MASQNTFVVLLRGVNVGGRKVSMAELKALVEKQGYTNVSTLLQSGNAILQAGTSAAKVKDVLEAAIGKKFSYPAKLFVYPITQIAKIANDYPFDTAETDFQHYVIFLKDIKPTELTTLPCDKELEVIGIGNDVVYWKVKKGFSIKSTFSKQLTKAKYKDQNTVRNINTLRKIIDKR